MYTAIIRNWDGEIVRVQDKSARKLYEIAKHFLKTYAIIRQGDFIFVDMPELQVSGVAIHSAGALNWLFHRETY